MKLTRWKTLPANIWVSKLAAGPSSICSTKLVHPRKDRGLLVFHHAHEAMNQVEHARLAAERFFNELRAWSYRQSGGNGRVRRPGLVPDSLSEELRKLASRLRDVAKPLASEEEQIELTSAADRCVGFGDSASNNGSRRASRTKSTGRHDRKPLPSAS